MEEQELRVPEEEMILGIPLRHYFRIEKLRFGHFAVVMLYMVFKRRFATATGLDLLRLQCRIFILG